MGEGSVATPVSGTAEGTLPVRRREPLPRAAVVLAVLLAAFAGWIGWRSWSDHRLKARLREEIRRDVEAREAAIPAPAPVDPERDAGPTYAAAAQAVQRAALNRLSGLLQREWPGKPLAERLEKDLALNAKAFDLFLRASSMPALSERDLRKWRPFDMATLCCSRAVQRLESGDPDGALRALLPLHRAARQRGVASAFGGPDLWHHRGAELLAWIAAEPTLGEEAAREGLAALLTPAEARSIADGFYRRSRLGQERSLLDLLGDNARTVMQRRGFTPPSVFDRLRERLRGRSLGTWGRIPGPRDVERARDALGRYDEIRAMEGKARFAALDEFEISLRDREGGGFVWETGLFEAAQLVRGVQYEAFLQLVRTALAVRIHEARTGSAPESLEVLVPGILDAVPVDPFTGEPVRYDRRPEGWGLSGSRPPPRLGGSDVYCPSSVGRTTEPAGRTPR